MRSARDLGSLDRSPAAAGWLWRLRRSRIAGNTGIMAIGTMLRLLLQSGSFIIVARFMGATGFGAFAGVVALVMTASCFSGWGCEMLLIRRVARQPSSFPRAFGSGLAYMAMTAPPL